MNVNTFDKAKNYVLGFGKYAGKSLNQVASDRGKDGREHGLLYLNWMAGLADLDDDTRDALSAFLGHPDVSADLVAGQKLDAQVRESRSSSRPAHRSEDAPY